MKNKKTIISLLIFLGLGLSEVFAQATMFVNQPGSVVSPYPLSSIRKLTFLPGDVLVHRTIGDTIIYAMDNVDFLNFNSFTTGLGTSEKNNGIFVYPNPTSDILQLNFDSKIINSIDMEIIDLQGRVLIKQSINSLNQTSVSVSHLAKGIYVCRLFSGNKIENIKFLKK
jgi:hypothetical protein